MVSKHLSTVSKVLFLQILIIVTVVVGYAFFKGRVFALDAFFGGMIAFIPNVYFAWRIKRAEGQDPKKIVRSFYAGESGKLILTAMLFAIIFQVPGMMFLPLMTGYIAVLSIFWFALILRES